MSRELGPYPKALGILHKQKEVPSGFHFRKTTVIYEEWANRVSTDAERPDRIFLEQGRSRDKTKEK